MSSPTDRKEKICFLLKGIETGDAEAAEVVNAEKYIQHNPQTKEGGEGLAVLFKRLSKTSPRVNIVRIFEDGDYIFGHTEYDFSTSRIGFEIFRFEGDQAVEHWDNIQSRQGPNPRISDGIVALKSEFSSKLENGRFLIEYNRVYRVLAQGSFVLSVCEGSFNGIHSSFYDLFRVEKEKIVEHWDTTESVPPREEWKNDNGKF